MIQARRIDYFTPTACGLVSRAWVIRCVGAVEGLDEATRRAWIDDLCSFEAPRMHGARNAVLFWVSAIGAALLADAAGLPGWSGFVAALVAFPGLARALATRTLRWRLTQLHEASRR